MNNRHLMRWTGLSAVVAGICFVVLELLAPPDSLSSVTTSRWAIAHGLAIVVSAFGLLGVTGIYARQAAAAGWLGRIGYLNLGLWLVLLFPFAFFELFMLPPLATAAPAFAEGYLLVITRSASELNFGYLPAIWSLSDISFLLGSLAFGIATLRAGVLSRWAAGVFTVGIGLAPAYELLPTALQPLVAVPIGLGLAWLGYALWAERPENAAQPVPGRERPSFARPAPTKRRA